MSQKSPCVFLTHITHHPSQALSILNQRLTWPRPLLRWRPQLTRIEPPCILCMLVVFDRVEDHPLLPSLLIKLCVRLPRPQQCGRRKDVRAAICALVSQPMGDTLDDAGRPDLVVLPSFLYGQQISSPLPTSWPACRTWAAAAVGAQPCTRCLLPRAAA
eukprot:907099-Prymnesium_polylepis.2